MNRRDFARHVTGAAAGAGVGSALLGGNLAAGISPAKTLSNSEEGIPFKLSVMLWTVFTKLPFEERLQRVAEAGYKAVELVGEYKNWTDADFDKYNAKRKQLGITFDTTAGLQHGVGNPHERDAFLADLKAALPIMERIDCPAIIVMSGNKVPGMDPRMQHQSCIDGLKRAAEMVEGRNVQLFLENIDPEENPHYYLTSVREGFSIIKAVNHPRVKFLYDFFHEQISEGNLIEKLEKNIDSVGLVHIADVPGRHEPGTGEINYRNIYRKLAELKYDRYVAMEFLPTGDPVGKLRRAREECMSAAQL